jgi:parallel beta-helix repeat protein/predicted outer membrane repeat protein
MKKYNVIASLLCRACLTHSTLSKKIPALLALTLATTCHAETIIPGGDVSGLWTLSGSPYYIEGDITLTDTDTLIIEPSVWAVFRGHYSFTIYGVLIAQGTEADSIGFTSGLGYDEWQGLDFLNSSSDSSILAYCRITESDDSGIHCSASSPDISHSRISANSAEVGCGIYCDDSEPGITNCTISGNSASDGGGIYCNHNSSPGISNCDLSVNSADFYGGGIYCGNSSPGIENCTLTDNSADSGGGGIYCTYNSNPIISNCTVSDNSSFSFGGGIYCWDSSNPCIIDGTISGNRAGTGGGIYCGYNSNPDISNCIISGNSAGDGGGINCQNSSSSITDCTISNNTGCGIYCSGSNLYSSITDCIINNNEGCGIACDGGLNLYLSITNCTISGNLASYGGGGGIDYSGHGVNSSITNCTISGNSTEDNGGGIYCFESSLNITNTIIEGNTSGCGIFYDCYEYAGVLEVFYGDFYDNVGGDFGGNSVPVSLGEIITVNANGDSCDTFFNIFEDPLFVDPGIGDFHLQGDSPCIDAGDPESPLDPDSTIADIGAFSYDQTPVIEPKPKSALPTEFAVTSVYPNPFNPTTTISFDLPFAGFVSLNIFDINGRNVGTVREPPLNKHHPPGQHHIPFDGSNLPSGIYVYHLTAGTYDASGKMVLMK